VRRITVLLALISTLPAAVCPTEGPVLRRILETEELVRQSSHCVAPVGRVPLSHQVRISGIVKLDILVDREGKVACVRVISGHPLLLGVSLEAARKWTFRPMMQRGRPVSFFGHLDFEFSMDGVNAPVPCISGR
jgi:hypothetical protein